MKLKIILVCIVLLANKCERPPLAEEFYPITIQNFNSDTIFADIGLGGKHPFNQFPDTTLPFIKPPLIYIIPDGASFHFDFRKPQEQIIGELISDTLSIYIFSKIVYRDTPWSNVRSSYQVLKRYD